VLRIYRAVNCVKPEKESGIGPVKALKPIDLDIKKN
jgi:hypothetical protein